MTPCSRCGQQTRRAPGQRWCHDCHAAYQRTYRKRRPEWRGMSEEQRTRHRARKRVQMRIRRGTLQRLPCAVCGDSTTDAHHTAGYEKPLDVEFLCHACHQGKHGKTCRC